MQHPAPWWYRLAARIVPGRCREIPEANNPTWPDGSRRIVLRQVALVKNQRELQVYVISRLRLFTAETWTWRNRLHNWFWLAVLWLASAVNLYLQQFACEEDPRFMHSHPYRRMLAIGLWGGYTERRIAGTTRRRRAPYLYAMDDGHVHHVQSPSRGHTSLFLGLGRAMDGTQGDKHYYGVPREAVETLIDATPWTFRRLWSDHIKVRVKRI